MDTLVNWCLGVIFIGAAYRDVTGQYTITYIGSYNMTVTELAFVASVGLIALYLRTQPVRVSVAGLLALSYFTLTYFNVGRGLLTSPWEAVLSLRATGAFAILLLLAMFQDKDQYLARKVRYWLMLTAVLLSVLVAFRLVLGPQFLMTLRGVAASDINDGGRALSAQGAFIISMALAVQLSICIRSSRVQAVRNWLVLAFLMIALVATRQGTANIAGFVLLVIVWFIEPGKTQATRIVTGLLVFVLAIVAAALMGLSQLSSFAGGALGGDLTQRSATFETRQLVWQAIDYARANAHFMNQLIGWPAGTWPDLYVLSPSWGRAEWTVSAHSQYYGTLLNLGTIGLIIYLGMVIIGSWIFVRRLFAKRRVPQVHISNVARFAILVGFVILGVSYELRNEVALLFAIVLMPIGAAKPKAEVSISEAHPALA